MNTKTIFKAMALAMLMPATLLTTACSSEDDIVNNNENTIKKGSVLPVTINVTRQGDNAATRATYNESTRKLEFSTGDKLLVWGYHVTAGDFSGTLDYDSEGKFSGTITTDNSYNGSAENLLSTADNADATLLPAGYESYHFLNLNTIWIQDYTKAFATSKATAIEQFSYESASAYSNGFALSPAYAILNFTITGLTPSTNYDVNFTEQYSAITGTVTSDASGTATFAMAKIGGSDLGESTLMMPGVNDFTFASKTLVAGKIYNITRSAAPAAPAAKALSAVEPSDVGKLVGLDGKIYATADAAASVSTNAVAMIIYVGDDHHGLALALNDEPAENWGEANEACSTTKNTYEPVTGASWMLPSLAHWDTMISAAGDYTALRDGFSSVGGTNMESESRYWSSSPSGVDPDGSALCYDFNDGSWNDAPKTAPDVKARACLAF